VRSHSPPNDNPYSEAAFKTLKYCPAFRDRLGSIHDARALCGRRPLAHRAEPQGDR
jgi:putative transposase